MGTINHNCIIATTWNTDIIEEIKEWVQTIKPMDIDDTTDFKTLFTFIPTLTNGNHTVIMAPDGSKEGWEISHVGDTLRQSFINKIESYNYPDGSNPFDWVEIEFGEFGQKVLRGNCENRYDNKEYYRGY